MQFGVLVLLVLERGWAQIHGWVLVQVLCCGEYFLDVGGHFCKVDSWCWVQFWGSWKF